MTDIIGRESNTIYAIIEYKNDVLNKLNQEIVYIFSEKEELEYQLENFKKHKDTGRQWKIIYINEKK